MAWPLIMIVDPGLPALLLNPGDGDGFVMAGVTVNDIPLLPGTPGFITVTVGVPAEATSFAVIEAVNCVNPTNVVARLVPFHCTKLVATKPSPLTVSVKAPEPAVADAGENPVREGGGLVSMMVNAAPPDGPPPGGGFATVTTEVPAEATSAALIVAVNWVELK